MIGQGVTNRFQDMKTRSKLFLGFGLVSLIIMIMASVGVCTRPQESCTLNLQVNARVALIPTYQSEAARASAA